MTAKTKRGAPASQTLLSCAEEWRSLPWKQFQKTLFRLQHRIFKAAQENNISSVKRLQNLILGSKCAKYLAVRQVTQLNIRRRVAGIDGVNHLQPRERLQLVEDLDLRDWNHQPLRKVWVSQNHAEPKLVHIPTLRDRAMQCLVQYALEPVYESQLRNGSYQRPGHSKWDVQNRIFQNLKANCNGAQKTVLTLNVEPCLDRWRHPSWGRFSQRMVPRSAARFLRSALRVGVLRHRDKPLDGPPSGAPLAALLCNLALDGVENLNNARICGHDFQRGIRYGDEALFFVFPNESVKALECKIRTFLEERGLPAEDAILQSFAPIEGFDFLGWRFRVRRSKPHTFGCYPSSQSRRRMIFRIKETMKHARSPLEERLKRVDRIYWEWWNYHQYTDIQQVDLWSFRYWLFKYLRKNSNQTHQEAIDKVSRIFNGRTSKMNGHRAVAGKQSVYDGRFSVWAERNARGSYGKWLKNAMKRQSYRCAACHLWFSGSDWVELHHRDGDHANYKAQNLQALHRACHQHQDIHREILLRRTKR